MKCVLYHGLNWLIIDLDLFSRSFSQAGVEKTPGVGAKTFFPPPLTGGGFTPLNRSGGFDGSSHGPIPFQVGPPDPLGIPPMGQGVLGRCDRGNLPSRDTPVLPPGTPSHQILPGGCPPVGNTFPTSRVLAVNHILNIFLCWLT